VKLLLDEHYSPRIAVELRRRGHDVVAAPERPELRGLADVALFGVMVAESRAIVRAATVRGTDHSGLILTSPRQFPRTSRAIGRLVETLDAFLAARPADDALRGQSWWLER